MSYKSSLPAFIAGLRRAADLTEDDVADKVIERAKERVPKRTRKLENAIHKEQTADGVLVVAGDGDVFYGHLVEHGGAYTAPRPFLVPAAEETRKDIDTLGRKRFQDL